MFIPYPKPVDKNRYKKNITNPERYYGLPKEIKFCKSCVISNQRPSSSIEFKTNKKQQKKTIFFDENGICDACKVKNKKEQINWQEREEELRELCDIHKRNDGNYDCLVPGSGGKDSFMTAHLLKYKYGMNPLTCTWAPHIYTDWGWKNHQAWIHAGFDNILFTPNGRVHRLITRISMDNIFHPFQPFFLGQKSLAPKIASKYGISLVFYGEHGAEYGNPKAEINSTKMSQDYFSVNDENEIYIGGSSLSQLRELGLTTSDWKPYLPIRQEVIESNNIEVHYLGYYEKWHPQGAYYYTIENGGFVNSPERTIGTYNTYNSIDDRIDDFHYHTTFIKFGIGRATYDAAIDIRSGEILRDEGISLVQKFDGEYPERWSKEIFEYLSINKEEFPEAYDSFESPEFSKEYYDLLCDNARSPHLWQWDEKEGWKLRKTIYEEIDDFEQIKSAGVWEGNKAK